MLAVEGDDAKEETEVAGEGGLVSSILMVSPVVTTLSPLGASWLSAPYFVHEIGQSERAHSRNTLAPSGLS